MPTSPPLPAANADPPAIPSQDVVESLPAPIVRLLLIFSGPIRGARVCLEVACWRKGRRMESWMIVGAWWGLCLGAKYAFRYLAPAILFLPLLPMSRLSLKRKPTQGTTTIHTHQTLLLTISDLHAINALLPPSPIPNVADLYDRFRQLGPRRLIRGCVVIWLAWIILGRVIGYRSLLALLGSIIFLAPSPPFAHLVHLLSRSLMIRRLIALLFLVAFGSPPDQSVSVRMYFSPVSWAKQKWAVSRRSSLAFSFQTKKTNTATISDLAIMDDDDDEETVEPVYFRFEVHENQRWWMGLDWTSALLPQERPSWCDSHLQPVSPPASFSLPPSSSVILPNAGKEGGRVKRTAIWKWYDDDWSIVRAGANAQGSQSTANPVPSPSIDEDGSHTTSLDSKRRSFSGLGTSPSNSNLDDSMAGRAHSMAEQAFTKGLERLKARTTSPAGPPSPKNSSGATLAAGMTSPGRTSGEFQRARKGSQASEDAKDNDPTQGGASSSSGAAPIETIAEKDDVSAAGR
ncbi:integral peroxisomal membrane peroxin-domain-containing protein [Kockovaella imperatae]|uniref:Integral peroxisomal membrane peroxin-domain-containing protein n=1 Tax=Kockovaella imperatae TaxID=4999 RepID=A0A1Y1UGN4_9TREE|nr:integral peroxisomal membrane peroxin-domain-containing protein [Kockovaella imperatae]ORX36664.1 integral peroxisomal membrane peroxin-domain-containing protein [Kockovaella imperatae]